MARRITKCTGQSKRLISKSLNALSTIAGAKGHPIGFQLCFGGLSMDGTGNFSSQDASHEPGIETPINIGTDERRMHVRAYNYWVSLLEGRAYPSIEDLDPQNLQDFGPNSVLLDFTSGIESPSISWLGVKLREACGLPVDVATVSEIPSRSLLSRLTDHYMQIIANRAPIGFEAEFVDDAGNEIMYRGILMPFSSDDDTIDFIYGVINWKEAADAELTESLTAEVERALEAAPIARQAPNVPAWADGPHAGDLQNDDLEDVLELSEEIHFPVFESDGSESLFDWLAAARISAEAAGEADARSRVSLYRALGQAFDFALAADERPEEYEDLLQESSLIAQPRAPMTPIVKLVFGIGYDKTRLAEYGMALNHGRRANVARGAFQGFVESYAGGLKAIVRAERDLRRSAESVPKARPDCLEKARHLSPKGIVELHGQEEFIVLVARRIDGEHVAVLGSVATDDKYVERALQALLK
jgi:hypothetical protein